MRTGPNSSERSPPGWATLREPTGAKKRRQLKSVRSATLDQEQKNQIRNSQPDWQTIWDAIPGMLVGDTEEAVESVAYSWFMETFEKDGLMASRRDRILKDTRQHSSPQGRHPLREGALS
ncbi:hypothetical protein CYMTET_31706 [Cymbomonas tetramitiformis]|uniref:Uncharacterized protein n=1 Tax=Cymbomonas tetramitiformis TaxID=36881 RepID=A0AAE0FGB4_9CHLO|nr:hypothetical protein CYMTET_31706 [Cymbomonas tetramitiformis]